MGKTHARFTNLSAEPNGSEEAVTKAGKSIGVPLNRDAVLVLRRWQGRHKEYVFCYGHGKNAELKPIQKAGGPAWRRALKRAEITDFRWHDLRHTWASWHVQAGTPLSVLKELGGWSSYQMVLKYAHLAPEHLAEHAARLESPLAIASTNPGTAGKDPELKIA